MPLANVSLTTIESFLARRRVAFVGMSREPQHISALLFKEFCLHGYDIIPVNPNTPEIRGRRCFARVQDIQPAPEWALLFTPPVVTNEIVRNCAEAGIKRIWLYRGGGQGAVSDQAVDFCKTHGIDVVPGQCPFMFLTPVRNIHWVHRCFAKLVGRYPRRADAATIAPA